MRSLNGGHSLASQAPQPAAQPLLPSAAQPPQPAAQESVPVAGRSDSLSVSISSLAEGWPEAVRQEIVRLSLVDTNVALPLNVIEQALKHGRIVFSWKMVRSWIRPAPLPGVSAHDSLVLELPLKVVAPLFLARQRETGKEHQRVAIDAEIPNLFFGFPQGDAAAAPAAAARPLTDTNYYVWEDAAEKVQSDESALKQSPSPGTKFVAKYATPNEIVSKAAALDGVAGVLIALPDGLMVASRLSPDLNGDTLAAFLPQIFGKVSQCTKELRMGELNNLNFTVGNVPWKIFRVNAIFFAAFGRAGGPLPTAQLAALAAELDHKPK
jgi:predicted regulator of Ras-like GTPase activity (Roadblock/LC7/MglB family)